MSLLMSKDGYAEYDVVIIGAGISGAVMAEHFVRDGKQVLVLDRRDHIGGNCYDYIDDQTGIRCHKYGPHYFHTNDKEVWEYVNRFATWERYENRVTAEIDGKVVSIPPNISTVNTLCGQHISTEEEMDSWLEGVQIKYENGPINGEEMAKSRVGEALYQKIFRDYTIKHWGRDPSELKPEVLARIPVRKNFDSRYFTDRYQALPVEGYTNFIWNMLRGATVRTGVDFFKIREQIPNGTLIVYTGPIDRYFADSGYEPLEYRSLNIVFERYFNTGFYQRGGQVNYPGMDVSWTRITEYKHLLNQKSLHTIISKEYGIPDGEPYYPVLNERNLNLYAKYKTLAEAEPNVIFVGRLANFKYFNMDQAVRNAMDIYVELNSTVA